MVDITQGLIQNNNRLNLQGVDINYTNDGMYLSGTTQFKTFDWVIGVPIGISFEKGRCLDKLLHWKSLTNIKDGGYYYPSTVDIVFSASGEMIDLEGEPQRFGER